MTQAKIAPYGGNSSFTEWINDYEHLCDTYKLTAEQRLANLLLNLKGPAKHCYRLKEKEHGAGFTYAIAVAALKAGFKTKNSKEEFLRILENRKFQSKDSYEDYYFDILRLCDKVNSHMTDSDICRYLIRGLPPKLSKEIYDSKPKHPSEVYEKLVDAAQFDSMMGKAPTIADEEINALAKTIHERMQKLDLASDTEHVNAFGYSRGRKGRGRSRGNNSGGNGNTRTFYRGRGNNYQGNNYRGNNYRTNNYQGNYRGNNYRGNNYRGNNYRGNNYRGNNYRGNFNNRGGYQGNNQGNFRGNYRGNFNNQGYRGGYNGNYYNNPGNFPNQNQNQNVHNTTFQNPNPIPNQQAANINQVDATGNIGFDNSMGNYHM